MESAVWVSVMVEIAPPRMDDYGRIQIAPKASGASKGSKGWSIRQQAADTGGTVSQGAACSLDCLGR